MAGYIGVQPVPKATQRREYFTAGNNQTVFNTSGYTPDYVDVYMNGVKLSPADFTATNGSDVVLASGAATGDLLQIISFLPFQAANQAFTGTFSVTGAVDFDSTLNVDGSLTGTTARFSGNTTIGGSTVTDSNMLNIQGDASSANIGAVFNKTNSTAQIWSTQVRNSDNAFLIHNYTANSTPLIIDTSSNVGIAMTPDSAVKLSVSGAIGPTNGSNSAPTHTFYSDPDTGMYRSGANALSFATGGTDALTINSSQNATFAGTITGSSSITATTTVNVGTGGGFYLKQDSSESTIRSESQPIVLQTFASGAWQDRLTIANNGDVDSATFFRAPNFYTGTGSQAFKANGNDINIVSQAGTTQMILKNDGCTTIQTGVSNVADEFIFAKFYASVSPGNAAGILLGGYPADGYAKQGIFLDRYAGFPGNGGRGDLLLVNKDANDTSVPTSADAKVKIEPTGNVTVMDGDLVIGTSGHGISFAATSDASGMSNELFDDYEEGTWTPSWGNGLTSVSYQTQFGKYTRIGNRIFGIGRVRSTAHSGSGNQVQVNGFPYTAANNTFAYHHFNFGHLTGFSYTGFPYGYVVSNNAEAHLQVNNNGTVTAINYPGSTTIDIIFAFMYEAA